ncbi:hypothetical protein CYY_009245 [Polysphondylium violaceum]|uniref:DUF2428 domain-containing protein n=1 Tax=Polysphondylium violaceum TaxID=133409 RepID=A0A8J4UWB8_9MYCE|nr:hypothetical protein CYY_009245 [Polysphondylium violaceum]
MSINNKRTKNLVLDQELFIDIDQKKKLQFGDELKQFSQTYKKDAKDVSGLVSNQVSFMTQFLNCNNNAQQLIQMKKLEGCAKLLCGAQSVSQLEESSINAIKKITEIILDLVFNVGAKNVQTLKAMSQTIVCYLALGHDALTHYINQGLIVFVNQLFIQQQQQATNKSIYGIAFLVDLNLPLDQQVFRDSQLNVTTCFKFIDILVERLSCLCQVLESSQMINVASPLYDCEHTLRTLVYIFSKYAKHMNAMIHTTANETINGKDAILLPIYSLSKQLERILLNATFPRQLATNSGYLVSEIIYLYAGESVSSIQSQILSSLFQYHPNTSVFDILENNFSSSTTNTNTPFYQLFKTFPDIHQLSVLRGLCLTDNFSPLSNPLSINQNENLFLNYILVKICETSSNSMDQHNRYISLEYLQLCLTTIIEVLQKNENQSIETIFPSLQQQGGYEHFFKKFFLLALDLVWKNWETSISSISQISHEIFDTLLTIHFLCIKRIVTPTDPNNQSNQFIKNITIKLIDEDWFQKSKYILLKYLLERVGPNYMIELRGNFLKNIFSSMIDHTICNSVKAFLESFIEQLKVIYNSNNSTTTPTAVDNQDTLNQVEEYWINPLLEVLTETDSVTSSRIILYALPSLLKIFPESLFKILNMLIKKKGDDTTVVKKNQFDVINFNIRIRISLALLNSSRQLSLVDGKQIQAQYHELIEKAMYHQDESLRLLALELVCVSPKNTERVTIRELSLIKQFTLLNLKGSSPFIRNQTLSTLSRFWTRLRESNAKVFRAQTNTNINIEKDTEGSDETDRYITLDDLASYIDWSCDLFAMNLYPGAPFPRKMLPLDALNTFVDAWNPNTEQTSLVSFLKWIESHCSKLYSKDTTDILVNNLWDTYDRCREISTNILLKFPSPLPGMETQEKIAPFLLWALKLACSPKARECDTGAFALKLYLKKYVEPNGLVPIFHSNPANPITFKKMENIDDAIIEYVGQIVRVLKSQAKIATKNLVEAAKFAPMHGLILSLRYIVEEISFKNLPSIENKKKWKSMVGEIVNLMKSISSIVLRVVADLAPEGNNPVNTAEGFIPSSLPSGTIYDDDERLASNFASSLSMEEEELGTAQDEDEEDEEEDDNNLGKDNNGLHGGVGQIITVCSWQCTKQISLVLGTLMDKVQMPSNGSVDSDTDLMNLEQIKEIGQQFLTILLTSRHKGAIEKTYLGFQVLCSTLMKSSHMELYSLPSSWIDVLFERVKEQSLQITRRSAGLPFAFIGILTGESTSRQGTNHLLTKVMETLLSIASGSGISDAEIDPVNNNVEKNVYLPQVHSINILKSIFRAKAIIQELDQYMARALITAIKAFSSPSWSVRNSATMAFSVLVDRIIGTKKLKSDNSILNTTTFFHFFSRMPSVYPFLLEHFKNSLAFISNEKKDQEEEGKIVQSSIYAILVLFSRLQPSNIDHPNDPLAPNSFVPLITQCCQFSNYMVRQISARALVPLVSTMELVPFVVELVKQINANGVNSNNNQTHGLLLQIYHLIKGHLPTMNSKDRETSINAIVEQVIPHISWMKSTSTTPPPLAFIFYSILMELQQSCPSIKSHPTIDSIVKETSAFLTSDQVNEPSNVTIPMYFVFIQTATEFVLHTLDNQSSSIIFTLFAHPFYDIRMKTIKFLLHNIPLLDSLDQARLQSMVIDNIKNENDVTLKKNNFKLLSLIKLPLNQQDESLYQLFVQMSYGTNTTMKKVSIVLLGHYLDQSIQQESIDNTQMIDQFILMINEYSVPEQPLELRQAVFKAIQVVSNIIKSNNNNSTSIKQKLCLEIWFTLVLLLEDDDESVRADCSTLVSNLLLSGMEQNVVQNSNGVMIMEGSKCLEEIFNLICNLQLCPEMDLYRLLKLLNLLKQSNTTLFSQDYQQSKVLFDKEQDNYFSEPMLMIQLVNNNLVKLIENNKNGAVCMYLEQEREDVLKQLLEATRWFKQTKENNPNSVWNHWLSFEATVFIPFYNYISTSTTLLCNGGDSSNTTAETYSEIQNNLLNITLHPILSISLSQFLKNIADGNNNNPKLLFLTTLYNNNLQN